MENAERHITPEITESGPNLTLLRGGQAEQSEQGEANVLLETLEKEGFLEIHKEGGKEYKVLDVEALKETSDKKMRAIQRENGTSNRLQFLENTPLENRDRIEDWYRQKERDTHNDKGFFAQPPTKNEFLFAALGEGGVVAKQDWRRGLKEEKPLFYIPKTKKEAFSPHAIAGSRFQIAPWEMSRSPGGDYPFSKEKIPYMEARMAYTIFHPRYGAGQRNAEGDLMVLSKGASEPRPISYDFFESYGMGSQTIVGISTDAEKVVPDLVKNHLLVQEDFQVLSERGGQKRRISKEIPGNGQFMIDSKRYVLKGEIFRGKEVQKVNDDIAVVLERMKDRTEPTHIFSLNNKPRSGTDYIKQEEMNIERFRPESFFPQRADENEHAYQLRLKELTENFVYGLDLAAKLSQEMGEENIYGFNIHEICSLASVALNMHKHEGLRDKQEAELLSFARDFGREGLTAFLSVEYGLENSDAVIALAEVNPALAAKIFKEYTEVYNLASQYVDMLGGGMTEKELSYLYEGIMRRAKEILVGSLPYEKRMQVARKHNSENPFEALGINPENALKVYQVYLRAYFDMPNGPEDLAKVANDLLKNSDKILYLCDVYTTKDPNLASIPRTLREAITLHEAISEKNATSSLTGETRDKFYTEYQEMNKDASETTADTEKEQARLFDFVKRAVPHKGVILDAGCGDGVRMTEPMARFAKKERLAAKVIGIDSLQSDHLGGENIEYKKGSITDMKEQIASESVDAVVNNWSIINDLLGRDEQNKAFREYSRVLKKGGLLYLDVPWLEGGVGSYEEGARKYHEEHPDKPYGTMEVEFASGGSTQAKNFHLYPRLELLDFLRENGFHVLNAQNGLNGVLVQGGQDLGAVTEDPFMAPEWRTQAGRPRMTVIAQKTGEASSSMAFRRGYPTHS